MAITYFGNRTKQAWIPAPRTGMDWSIVRRTSIVQLENGGVYVDDSRASHREGLAEWEENPADLRPIKDFINGVHGDGPFYWCEPFAMVSNAFSPNWATPGIIADGDWAQIANGKGVAATLPTGILGLPTRAITYTPNVIASNPPPPRRFTILIPPGHKLAFGCHGTYSAAGTVTLRSTPVGGPTQTLNFLPLDPAGITSFNTTDAFRYSEGHRLVDVWIARTSLTASTVTLSGMRAILLREEDSIPSTGQPFVSGEGTGGLRFSGNLRETLIYGGGDPRFHRKGMSIRLIETGDWE